MGAPDDIRDGLRRDLDAARQAFHEDPAGAFATAVRCQELARRAGADGLLSRALSLQGAIRLHRGDLRGAFGLAAEAELHAAPGGDRAAYVQLAALKAHLTFLSGSYGEALRRAEEAVALADAGGGIDLRIYARRAACLVFGNIGVRDWPARLHALLALTIEAGNRWEEAISRNDLAHHLMEEGALDAAEREIDHARSILLEHGSECRFGLGVVACTRADILLHAGRHDEALADAEHAVELLASSGEPNPYVVAMTVLVEVGALQALGRFDDAERSGQRAVESLGERVPHARSLILATIAAALREAGRIEDAYDALSASAELERKAFQELSELQLGLERATLEIRAARQEADALAARNLELEAAANRDWLTGLHNRRFLAGEIGRLSHADVAGPFALAVVDLDHFKAVNDQYGHEVGDRVLVRVAALLLDGLRQEDVVVRTGGEEFVVLMPGTGGRAAASVCERLRCAIADEPWERILPGIALTASVGLAAGDEGVDLDRLARLADQRLYAAKHAGRDRVVAGP
jgi:diguanylate cyclase (GGDEF)-like protein